MNTYSFIICALISLFSFPPVSTIHYKYTSHTQKLAEESALVLGQESNGDSMRQKFQQTVITLFDTEVMVSGSNQGDNELANWQEIAPGSHTFPFALKVPNVNFPPCIPVSFSFVVLWLAG